jgi:SAM-dependent methyltransferase
MKHPAKYSDCLLPIFLKYLKGANMVLDPFAGTGKLKDIIPKAILLEIEFEWASINNGIVADSQYMPFRNEVFDAVCTSPTYGNRMADHFVDHQLDKNYIRSTYRNCLRRDLHINNSGRMQWGEKYRKLHINVWNECKRVLKNNGLLILNISDHIRNGKQIEVSKWHVDILKGLGFSLIEQIEVKTHRQRMGKNSELRVEYEYVFIFRK